MSCEKEASSEGLILSGTITAAQGTNIDSDVNDPNNIFSVNNKPEQAQVLSSPLTLAGYLTHSATKNDFNDDNFAHKTDQEDHYLVKLFKNEVITLEISDWQTGDNNDNIDFSLAFFPISNAEVSDQIADGSNRFEQLIVPENGHYRIVVTALAGSSNYSLSIGSNHSFTDSALSTQSQFINEQFIYSPPALSKMKGSQTAALRSTNNKEVINDMRLRELAIIHLKGKKNSHQLLASHQLSYNIMARSQRTSQFKLSPQTQARYNTLQKLKELKQSFGQNSVSLNYRYQAQHIPNDPMFSMQWHYPQISLPLAWDLVKEHQASAKTKQRTTIVAVIDTGIFLDHEDLQGQLVSGYDFIVSDATANDGEPGIDNNPDDPGDGSSLFASSWHGTHVAGIIAAHTDNNIGIAGVGINTKIMPIRVLGVDDGTTYDIIQGLKFAAGLENDSNSLPTNKADIINMSLGGTDNDPALKAVIQKVAGQENIIIVAAAGNNASHILFYPAAYPEVISVSAVGANNQAALYTNFGNSIDIAAPGGDQSVDDGIISTLVELSGDNRQSSYEHYQGTSVAAPHVAGVLALMKTIYPKLTNQQLQNLLISGLITDDLGHKGKDDFYGYGLINAYKAVYQAKSLALGGSLQPIITTSMTQVAFDLNNNQQLITLSQVGDSPNLYIDELSSDVPWLSLEASDTDQQDQLGLYLLTANTKDLEDGLYTGMINIVANNGSDISISVSLRVDRYTDQKANANTGALYLFLVDSNNIVVRQTEPLTPINGEYNYSFSGLAAGYYYLQAGSDIDNDYIVCDLGESCAAWPVLAEPEAIKLESNLSEVNFTASINSVIYQMANLHTKSQIKTLQRQAEHTKGKTLELVSP